eukprot:TRINITY_DN5789_c0_g1_i2.p2 TRINITY_DN5789_c0_g1~~TRINITY_DN5789_c0_g1_i2.p2  ORF type:complete len:122 (-),score=17.98 TRINITY_DN5789_c0_g1_i2:813-1178(-)
MNNKKNLNKNVPRYVHLIIRVTEQKVKDKFAKRTIQSESTQESDCSEDFSEDDFDDEDSEDFSEEIPKKMSAKGKPATGTGPKVSPRNSLLVSPQVLHKKVCPMFLGKHYTGDPLQFTKDS